MKDLIDENPLGGKSLSSIMSKNTIEEPAKGLSNLLSKAKPKENNEYYPSDQQLNNEFLRLEREKNKAIESKLENVIAIPQEVQSLKNEINELRDVIKDAMDQTLTTESINNVITEDEEIKKIETLKAVSRETFNSLLKSKQVVLYAVITLAIVLGMVLGQFIFGTQVETKIIEVPKKEVIKVIPKSLPQFVTTKFVNMRTTGSSKGDVLFTISPNQKIELLEKKGGWWKVSFNNMLQSKTYKGWVYFENLKSLK
jgi:hypothetical protein